MTLFVYFFTLGKSPDCYLVIWLRIHHHIQLQHFQVDHSQNIPEKIVIKKFKLDFVASAFKIPHVNNHQNELQIHHIWCHHKKTRESLVQNKTLGSILRLLDSWAVCKQHKPEKNINYSNTKSCIPFSFNWHKDNPFLFNTHINESDAVVWRTETKT